MELFEFLAQQVAAKVIQDKELLTTYNEDVISALPFDKKGLLPCNHEEADTRMLLHAAHASRQGHSKIMIRTVDTDVVVLAIANFYKISVSELWIAFGTGKQLRYIPVHTIAHIMMPLALEGLPFFHAVTGCDTVSVFSGKGKKGAYEAWKSFPQVSASFGHLSARPDSISGADFEMTGKFVVLLYSRSCPASSINEVRQLLFSQGTRTLENIPPTEDALLQHVKRAAYQADFIWGQSLENIQQLPNLSDWGWQQIDDRWTPRWITLPQILPRINSLWLQKIL